MGEGKGKDGGVEGGEAGKGGVIEVEGGGGSGGREDEGGRGGWGEAEAQLCEEGGVEEELRGGEEGGCGVCGCGWLHSLGWGEDAEGWDVDGVAEGVVGVEAEHEDAPGSGVGRVRDERGEVEVGEGRRRRVEGW